MRTQFTLLLVTLLSLTWASQHELPGLLQGASHSNPGLAPYDPKNKPGSVTIRPARGTRPSALTIKIEWDNARNCNQKYPCHYEMRVTNPGQNPIDIDHVQGTSYTHSGMQPGRTYRFQVRACNSCGHGPWCDFEWTPCATPATPQICQVKADCNNVMVRWTGQTRAFRNAGQATSFKLEVADRNGRMREYKGCSGARSQCSIPVAELKSGWGLQEGGNVQVQVTACNNCGTSQPIRGNTCTLKNSPPKCVTPRGTCGNGSSFTVSWAAQSQVPGVKYELYWDGGSGSEPSTLLMPLSNRTSFLVQKKSDCCAYKFKVRACTPCGKGQFSSVLNVRCTGRIVAPRSRLSCPDGCNINVQWMPAAAKCTKVTHYSVEVGCAEKSIEWPACTGNGSSCTIPMQQLQAHGFPSGTMIKVRVFAHNGRNQKMGAIAEGEPIRMISSPPMMQNPRGSLMAGNTRVRVCWTAPHNLRSGLKYELYVTNQDSARAGNPMSSFKLATTTDQTCAELPCSADKLYRFVVRAKNICGFGPVSQECSVRVPSPPKPQTVCNPSDPESPCYHEPEPIGCDPQNPQSPCYHAPEPQQVGCDPTDPYSPCYHQPEPVGCDPKDPYSPCYHQPEPVGCDPQNPQSPCYHAPEPQQVGCDPTDPYSPCYHQPEPVWEPTPEPTGCNPADPFSPCFRQPAPEPQSCNPKDPFSPCFEPTPAPICDPFTPGSCGVNELPPLQTCDRSDPYSDCHEPEPQGCNPSDPQSPCFVGPPAASCDRNDPFSPCYVPRYDPKRSCDVNDPTSDCYHGNNGGRGNWQDEAIFEGDSFGGDSTRFHSGYSNGQNNFGQQNGFNNNQNTNSQNGRKHNGGGGNRQHGNHGGHW